MPPENTTSARQSQLDKFKQVAHELGATTTRALTSG